MKYIFIFTILCLAKLAKAGVMDLQNGQLNFQEMFNTWLSQCAIEQAEKSSDMEDSDDKPEDLTCMLGCGLRKISSLDGTNLHDGLLELVNIAYEEGFDSTEFTREEVESKINNCFAQGDDECQQFACLDHNNSPVADVFAYDLKLFMDGPFGGFLNEVVENWQN